jgi:hypothetical protein
MAVTVWLCVWVGWGVFWCVGLCFFVCVCCFVGVWGYFLKTKTNGSFGLDYSYFKDYIATKSPHVLYRTWTSAV